MTADHTPERRDRCRCANDGHALRCPVHTQEDFDAAELTREGTADRTPERLSAEDREAIEQRVREWMRSASESYAQPVGSDAWVRGLVGYLTSGPNSVEGILAAHLADVEARLAEQSETIAMLCDGYREAVGVPPSEHQSRRLEAMATRIEELMAENSALRAALHPDPSEVARDE